MYKFYLNDYSVFYTYIKKHCFLIYSISLKLIILSDSTSKIPYFVLNSIAAIEFFLLANLRKSILVIVSPLITKNDFYTIRLPWEVHPERDQAWFEKETRNMSRREIAQELECNFNASGETVIHGDDFTILGYERELDWFRGATEK